MDISAKNDGGIRQDATAQEIDVLISQLSDRAWSEGYAEGVKHAQQDKRGNAWLIVLWCVMCFLIAKYA